MKSNLEIIGVILFGVIIISMISFEQAWAANATTFKEIKDNPSEAFLTLDGKGTAFFAFIAGIAIYSLFVWYFYRFISRRAALTEIIRHFDKRENRSRATIIIHSIMYIILFPIIIFVWFTVLAFFIYIIAEGMPLYIAIFISMTIIAVVRVLSYYREEAAKEVAKMIPYAILSFLLTSVAIYANPNFFLDKDLHSIPDTFIANIEGIITAVLFVSAIEFTFRILWGIKRRYRPVVNKILEDEIELEVKEITKVHFKKIEDKEKWLEKKIEEKSLEFKKIEDQQKELENKLKELQKKSNDSK
jgi:hypothetical protein